MPTTRKWLVAAALFGWVVVVVVGAGSRSSATALLGVDHVGGVFIVAMALLALSGLVLIVLLNPFRDGWTEPDRKRRSGVGFLLLLVLAILVWQPQLLDNFVQDEEQSEQGAEGADPIATPDLEPPAETVAQATDLMLIVACIAAIGAVWYFASRRSAPGPDALVEIDEAFEADFAVAIEQAGAELAEATTPRDAVLRAYAILESSFASHGVRRMSAETSTEHVRRALRNLRVDPAPVVQLAALYEVARFSDRTITVEDQQRAAHALEMARTELVVHL